MDSDVDFTPGYDYECNTIVTKLIQMVPTPTHVIKDPYVMISMNALLEHITVTNMSNVTIMRAHSHAHVNWYRIWSRILHRLR